MRAASIGAGPRGLVRNTAVLAGLLLSAGAMAALPWAVSGQGSGSSLADALGAARGDAQARCHAAGLAPAGNLMMTEYQLNLSSHWVRVQGNCGGPLAAGSNARQ